VSQIERIVYLDRRLREARKVTVNEAAERFEASPRQIKRDIEYLKDRLGAPIVYDRSKRHYVYEKTFTDLEFADERILLYYVLLTSLSSNESYFPVVTRKILDDLRGHLSRDYLPISERISYQLSLIDTIDMEHLALITEAMLDGRRLDMRYTNAKGERSERTIDPERLVNYSGRWYLIAWDTDKSAFRTFHLSRIDSLKMSREKSRADLDQAVIQRYLESGFGIYLGESTSPATVRIKGNAAILVARQTWHKDQTSSRGSLEDGTPFTDITVPVSNPTELLGRILSYGSFAEPIAPESLRQMWREEIGRMADIASKVI
jgi:predicted DNA-binding transcriptional regulator YafY